MSGSRGPRGDAGPKVRTLYVLCSYMPIMCDSTPLIQTLEFGANLPASGANPSGQLSALGVLVIKRISEIMERCNSQIRDVECIVYFKVWWMELTIVDNYLAGFEEQVLTANAGFLTALHKRIRINVGRKEKRRILWVSGWWKDIPWSNTYFAPSLQHR